MGTCRETRCIYTAEMRCVFSNPVRKAFAVNIVYMLNTHHNQAAAATQAIRAIYPNLINLYH